MTKGCRRGGHRDRPCQSCLHAVLLIETHHMTAKMEAIDCNAGMSLRAEYWLSYIMTIFWREVCLDTWIYAHSPLLMTFKGASFISQIEHCMPPTMQEEGFLSTHFYSVSEDCSISICLESIGQDACHLD